MKKKFAHRVIGALTKISLVLLGAGLLLALNGCAQALQSQEAAPKDDRSGIEITFKLDPRLTKGMYMGERWVSPPVYTRVGEGKEVTVEAQARVMDATGRQVAISPVWTAADPDMVTVTPGQGKAVDIIVKRAGQTSLKITSSGITKELVIKATARNNVIQVDISQ